jgi:hypothetical protein
MYFTQVKIFALEMAPAIHHMITHRTILQVESFELSPVPSKMFEERAKILTWVKYMFQRCNQQIESNN